MTRSKRTPITSDNPVISGPRAWADRLYRASCECVRQRQRYSALVEAGSMDEEQKSTLAVASQCDAVLHDAIGAFEGNPSTGPLKDEEWYKKAILLWQASREYERRHRTTEQGTKKLGSMSGDDLKSLTLEYDLEASALLALQHAVAAYRKSVPEAHIEATSSRLS